MCWRRKIDPSLMMRLYSYMEKAAVYNYADLLHRLLDMKAYDLLEAASNNTYLCREYLMSKCRMARKTKEEK